MAHLASVQPSLPHLRLTPPQIFDLWQQGHYTPKGYLYHLVLAHKRAGWWWRIDNVAEFCRKWDINRRTFYRAKAALIHEGRFEEVITSSVELRVTSTSVCVTGVTPVSDESQRVSDESQSVTNGSQVTAETTSQRGLPAAPDLIQIFKQLTTPKEVCVPVENFSLKEIEQEEFLPSQPKEEIKKRSSQADSEKGFTPPILQRAKKLGVNVCDRILLKAVERWPERVAVALDCLDEKQPTVNYPTRFLQRAIEEDWQPEKSTSAPTGFGDWFNEARKRGIAIASEMRDNVLHIFTADQHWLPFEQLRRMSWDELSARINPINAVEAQAIPIPGT